MGHFVLGYPTLERSIEIAQEYSQNGVDILECQYPFSDPSADGSIITEANLVACNYSNKELMDTLKIIANTCKVPIVLMSYITRIHHIGYLNFFKSCKEMGISTFILPDIPYDEAIRTELVQTLNGLECTLIPVVSANTSTERLIEIDTYHFPFYYVMSYFGTTGNTFSDNPKLIAFIKKLRKISSKEIGIGFGVQTREHVSQINSIANFAIMGSELLKHASSKEQLLPFLKTLS